MVMVKSIGSHSELGEGKTMEIPQVKFEKQSYNRVRLGSAKFKSGLVGLIYFISIE